MRPSESCLSFQKLTILNLILTKCVKFLRSGRNHSQIHSETPTKSNCDTDLTSDSNKTKYFWFDN